MASVRYVDFNQTPDKSSVKSSPYGVRSHPELTSVNQWTRVRFLIAPYPISQPTL